MLRGSERTRGQLGSWLARNGIVLALVVEIIVFSRLTDNFLTVSNFSLVLLQIAIIGIVAVPEALLLLSGYVDFAVGSTLGLTAVLVGKLLTGQMNVVEACLIVLATSAVIGAAQGLLATRLQFPPFIVTLGFYTGVRGLGFVTSGGQVASQFGTAFAAIGNGKVWGLGIPISIALAIVAFGLGAAFLYQTRWGRHVVAIGGNPTAAYLAGIRVNLLPFLLYISTALAAGIGGLILTSQLDAAPPTLGDGLELDVLSAVLLGGVAFGGGRGSLLGVAAGVLFIGLLNNGLLLLGVAPFWFRVSSGSALVVAAGLDALSRRIKSRRS
jgi:ribose/xylose/arabinose/galactoside ABC-type transport system permease subunit